MKNRQFLTAVFSGASILLATHSAQATLVVYEGFDYTAGSEIDGQGGSVDGWGGSWSATGNNGTATIPAIGTGLGFGSLDVSGGSMARNPRNGRSWAERAISGASQSALTADSSSIWFSVLMSPSAGNGFENNTWGTLIFGNAGLSEAGTASAAPIGAAGSAVGVSFSGGNGVTPVDNLTYANMTIQGVTYSGGILTEGSADRIIVGGDTSLIVGRVDWAANGLDDTLALFDVSDPSAALPAAFTTMSVDLDQSGFNVISISGAQTPEFDEIRFGSELGDVLPIAAVPEPSSLALLGLASVAFLRRKRP